VVRPVGSGEGHAVKEKPNTTSIVTKRKENIFFVDFISAQETKKVYKDYENKEKEKNLG